MTKFEKKAIVLLLVTEFWGTFGLFDTVQQRIGTQLRVGLIEGKFFFGKYKL